MTRPFLIAAYVLLASLSTLASAKDKAPAISQRSGAVGASTHYYLKNNSAKELTVNFVVIGGANPASYRMPNKVTLAPGEEQSVAIDTTGKGMTIEIESVR